MTSLAIGRGNAKQAARHRRELALLFEHQRLDLSLHNDRFIRHFDRNSAENHRNFAHPLGDQLEERVRRIGLRVDWVKVLHNHRRFQSKQSTNQPKSEQIEHRK